jgi:hypothetical protein
MGNEKKEALEIINVIVNRLNPCCERVPFKDLPEINLVTDRAIFTAFLPYVCHQIK